MKRKDEEEEKCENRKESAGRVGGEGRVEKKKENKEGVGGAGRGEEEGRSGQPGRR